MESEIKQEKPSLRDYRSKKPAKLPWLRKHATFLFHWDSLFYFSLFLFVLGVFWAAYPFFTNSATQLLNWDYTWQYISFTYDYWDAWHVFFTAGKFPLYDSGVYMGTDMIGSGSYYGLFDPFMFICYLFPRSWIPQMYAQMTFAKLMCGGLFMRMYLVKMGIKEWTARLGSIIYAFSGFTTFFMGAPNFTSSMAYFPLILFGIEKVIRDQKIIPLSIGIALLGISCFFYVPVICIFGVIYALWRFFSTIKERDKHAQIKTMLLGISGFAIGLLISAFSLVPSLRETFLSGRGVSIGGAYLHSVISAFKSADAKSFFGLIFEEVGDSPGRELMGVLSFFFPVAGWTNLPFERGGYDAWTASLFCYTPCVILFFAGIINSIRLKKWSHLVIILLCVFAVFTNLSYFLFYAFSGNGYGRWYLVLVPLIVYYCCWAFDLRKEAPKFIPFAASIIALVGMVMTFYLTDKALNGVTFSVGDYNVHHTTYWQTSYKTANEVYNSIAAVWYFYYQLGFVIFEGVLLCVGYRKKWLTYAFIGLVCVEVLTMGNASYAFNGTWSLENSYVSGSSNMEYSLRMTNAINEGDKSFFRTFSDTYYGSDYAHNVFGTNNVSSFHSLMNFDVEEFALINQIKFPGSSSKTYGDEVYYNPNWSGHYGNKRYAADTLLGYRYYIVKNDYSGWKDDDGNPMFLPANVPFDSEEMTTYSPNRNLFRVYKRSEQSLPILGYGVDDSLIYRIGAKEDSFYLNDFFGNYANTESFRQLMLAEYVQLNGAIIQDEDTLPDVFNVREELPSVSNESQVRAFTGKRTLTLSSGLTGTYYETKNGDGLFPANSSDYANEGLAYFINHYESKKSLGSVMTIKKDIGKMVYAPSSGIYFNEDANGCYLQFHFYNTKTLGAPRVYAIGDRFDENGNLLQSNVCLGFDGYLLPNATHTNYYVQKSCTFGLYANGRVKYFVLCYPSTGELSVSTSQFYLSVTERSQIETEEASRKEKYLQNVQKDVNSYTFETNYSKPTIVVTQLGYDKGWKVKAKGENGASAECQMLKLDGGLVGFVAPGELDANGNAVKFEYNMIYNTPYSALSITATIGGLLLIVAIPVGETLWLRHKAKRKDDQVEEEI